MALGAVLNAAAFTGGNYLAKYLSGDSGKAALDEKIRHGKALEQYQAAYAQYQKNRTKLLDWIATNDRMKHQASQDFKSTDIALARYNQMHQNKSRTTKSPSSRTSTSPARNNRLANSCSLAEACLRLGILPFASCKPYLYTPLWIPNYRRSTTAPGATGKVLQLSKNWPLQPEPLKR